MQKMKLLLVEDEFAISQGLNDVFIYHGFDVDIAETGLVGLDKFKSGKYDLIILDVMLPGLDGFSVCNEIRKVNRDQPIIMLTAKSSDEDIIHGLTLGADDYVSKPFSVEQLVLRVKAVLKRSGSLRSTQRHFRINGHIEIDTLNLNGKNLKTGQEIAFTRKELEVLQYLAEYKDRPVSREELLMKVWNYKDGKDIETRTVDIHLAKLRRKIEPDPKNPTYLTTVRGEGYRLKVADE